MTAKEWLDVIKQAADYNPAMTNLIEKYGEMLVQEYKNANKNIMKDKITLEIPKEDIEEVIHLLRYSISEQRVSNDAWVLLMNFCEDNSEIKFDGKEEDLIRYSTKYDNNKI